MSEEAWSLNTIHTELSSAQNQRTGVLSRLRHKEQKQEQKIGTDEMSVLLSVE